MDHGLEYKEAKGMHCHTAQNAAAAGAVNIIAALNCRTGNQRKHRPS